MRTYKDISEYELLAIVKETIYYYLLNDITTSDGDVEYQKEAIKTAITRIDDKELIDQVLKEIKEQCDPKHTYDEFEDYLFQIVEDNI